MSLAEKSDKEEYEYKVYLSSYEAAVLKEVCGKIGGLYHGPRRVFSMGGESLNIQLHMVLTKNNDSLRDIVLTCCGPSNKDCDHMDPEKEGDYDTLHLCDFGGLNKLNKV